MSTIKIKCVDQVLAFQNMPIITTGDQNIDQVQFDFCPLWDGFIKVAVFFQQKTDCSYSIVNADGTCPIPNSFMKLTGKFYILVTGTNINKQVRTSNILSYTIDEGHADASLQDEFPSDLTEEEQQDIFYQMLKMATDMQDLCQDLIKNFAYIRKIDANEFEYDESKLEAKVRAYTYPRSSIDTMISNLKDSDTAIKKSINDLKTSLTSSINSVSASVSNLEGAVDTKLAVIEQNISNLEGIVNDNYNRLYNLIRSNYENINAIDARLQIVEDYIKSQGWS